ncbi:MAG TPA: hypothetical protein VHE60_08180 [Pyrinomonadaceae bacterium]|nr:hypothetical protein [Pyrinomonadaceae bacterium]
MQRLPDIRWQDERDDDLWQVFRALGNGFKAVMMQASDGQHVSVTGTGESGNAEFYVEPEIIKELQSFGLVNENYELSEKGVRLHETLRSLSGEDAKQQFLAELGAYRTGVIDETHKE